MQTSTSKATEAEGSLLDQTVQPVDTVKGDVNMDGEVNFADIPPFIAALQAGDFLAEADVNCDLTVNFSDIPTFIAVLQMQ